jgi:Flp pilus assembly protein CpaB
VGVSSRRTLILIAAVVVGALSAFLVYNYVNSADSRARSNARQVQVLKIAKDIPRGLSGREAEANGMIVKADIAAEFKPVTAIVDPSIVQDKVAVANYTTGQILVEGMFADPIENQITFAGRVPNDCALPGTADSTNGKPVPCVAITISVDQTRGVAGVIVPGDFINILVQPETGYCKAPDAQGALGIEGSKGSIISKPDAAQVTQGQAIDGGTVVCNPARFLYQAAKVLFVDRTAVPQPGEITAGGTTATPTGTAQTTVNTGLITIEVPPAAALLIASIAPEELYLTLLPQNYVPEALPRLDPLTAVLPGEDATKLTPYGPQGFQGQK